MREEECRVLIRWRCVAGCRVEWQVLQVPFELIRHKRSAICNTHKVGNTTIQAHNATTTTQHNDPPPPAPTKVPHQTSTQSTTLYSRHNHKEYRVQVHSTFAQGRLSTGLVSSWIDSLSDAYLHTGPTNGYVLLKSPAVLLLHCSIILHTYLHRI